MADDDRHGHYESTDAIGLFEKGLNRSLRIDARYSVLDFKRTKYFLHIFTDSVANAIRISRVYRKESADVSTLPNASFKIKVALLPDKSVGKLIKGMCHVGVAPVRKSNDSSSEQVTQVLYGESFDTLQIVGDWIRVRLRADGYIGWVSVNQVTLFSEEEFGKYRSLSKVYVTEKILQLFEKPRRNSPALREAVYGSELAVVGNHEEFFEVKLPDGSSAYAEKTGVVNFSPVEKLSVKNLLNMAHSFQGISYVWGGRSTKGFDCSGFVQTVFRSNGVELPRDSGEQFRAGKSVGKNLRSLQPGDLLFFSYDGRKVSHVALYIGEDKKFIHSSGYVRVNSFDPKRDDFNKKLYSIFIGACRIAQ
ncbi:MAG: C40 family peptidase [Candidatus Kryptoniota bacterium]